MEEDYVLQIYKALGKTYKGFPPDNKELLRYLQLRFKHITDANNDIKEIDSILTEIENLKVELKRRRRLAVASLSGAKRALNYALGKHNITINLVMNQE